MVLRSLQVLRILKLCNDIKQEDQFVFQSELAKVWRIRISKERITISLRGCM
jgi:hypothetical protein